MINILQILYTTNTNNNSNNDYKITILITLILGICILYISIKKTIEYKKYKNAKLEKDEAIITSFDGAKTTGLKEYYKGNIYSYSYTINNKTYNRKNYISKETYNIDDTINILYDINKPEDSISIDEFEKTTEKENIIVYYAISIILILLSIISFFIFK